MQQDFVKGLPQMVQFLGAIIGQLNHKKFFKSVANQHF
jgi:hypothetical protein